MKYVPIELSPIQLPVAIKREDIPDLTDAAAYIYTIAREVDEIVLDQDRPAQFWRVDRMALLLNHGVELRALGYYEHAEVVDDLLRLLAEKAMSLPEFRRLVETVFKELRNADA